MYVGCADGYILIPLFTQTLTGRRLFLWIRNFNSLYARILGAGSGFGDHGSLLINRLMLLSYNMLSGVEC